MPKTRTGETRAKLHAYVCECILRGEPPSVREVQDEFGFKSTATVREHLDGLVEAGLLERVSGKDRGYRLPGAPVPGLVPLLGRVQAGSLTEAIESADGYVPLDGRLAVDCFALTVRGESMAGREIHDGDLVLVRIGAEIRHGDVVVAMIGEDATVKTYCERRGRVVLKAENPDYEDIVPDPEGDDFRILGRVFEIRRQL